MSEITKYEIIKNDLLSQIHDGVLKESDKVPSENKLAKQYGVSVITARKALLDLMNSGHIIRVKGKGSFVSGKRLSTVGNTGSSSRSGMRIVTLIVLMYENSDSSTMQIIRGAQSYLATQGYSLIIECSHDNVETEALIINKCIQNHVDGVLLFSADPEANIQKIRELALNDIPLVMIDRLTTQLPVSWVGSYNMYGMYTLTKYLIENQHRRILFAADNLSIGTEKSRYEGFLSAFVEAGLKFDEEMLIPHITGNASLLYQLIKDKEPTAVVCVNDRSAILTIDYLHAAGLRVPDDISVTGYDDSEMGRYKSPSLTTVHQPFEEIGTQAAMKLIELINGAAPSQIQLPVQLIVRESTKAVAAMPRKYLAFETKRLG